MSKTICLDFGHAQKDSGAVGKNGTYEKNINLSVGLKIANYLKQNKLNVVMTRESDDVPWDTTNMSVDLRERVKIANKSNADVFVSIHCNSATNRTAKGFEIYSTRGQNNSDILATKINARVKATFPNFTYREDWSDGDVDKEAGFYVIQHSNMTSCLIEQLFISNPEEEKILNDPVYQDKMAFAIAQGIGDFLGVIIEKQVNQETMKPKIKVNNKVIEGILYNNQTLAPVRAFGEALGKEVVYKSKDDVTVGGVKIDVILIGNISYAKVRYLSEKLGKTVKWDEKTQTVTII